MHELLYIVTHLCTLVRIFVTYHQALRMENKAGRHGNDK